MSGARQAITLYKASVIEMEQHVTNALGAYQTGEEAQLAGAIAILDKARHALRSAEVGLLSLISEIDLIRLRAETARASRRLV